MPMNEVLLKTIFSPSEGRTYGRFNEGYALAEAMGTVVALEVTYKNGERVRQFGQIVGVTDRLRALNSEAIESIEELFQQEDQVMETIIYFEGRNMRIVWAEVAVAVAEVAVLHGTEGEES